MHGDSCSSDFSVEHLVGLLMVVRTSVTSAIGGAQKMPSDALVCRSLPPPPEGLDFLLGGVGFPNLNLPGGVGFPLI
jgi:hypothetical protein